MSTFGTFAPRLPGLYNGAQSSGMVLIETQNVPSGGTNIYFTQLSPNYKTYAFIWYNLTSAGVQVSTNNGVSYISTGYTGGYNYTQPQSAATWTAGSITDRINMNFTGGTSCGILFCHNIGLALTPLFHGQQYTSNNAYAIIGGSNSTTTPVNAFTVASGSTFTAGGVVSLYGILQ